MRIWKLGSLDHGILPTKEAINSLSELLASNPDDIVWGPDLQVQTIGEDNHDVIISEEFCIRFLNLLGYKVEKDVS